MEFRIDEEDRRPTGKARTHQKEDLTTKIAIGVFAGIVASGIVFGIVQQIREEIAIRQLKEEMKIIEKSFEAATDQIYRQTNKTMENLRIRRAENARAEEEKRAQEYYESNAREISIKNCQNWMMDYKTNKTEYNREQRNKVCKMAGMTLSN